MTNEVNNTTKNELPLSWNSIIIRTKPLPCQGQSFTTPVQVRACFGVPKVWCVAPWIKACEPWCELRSHDKEGTWKLGVGEQRTQDAGRRTTRILE